MANANRRSGRRHREPLECRRKTETIIAGRVMLAIIPAAACPHYPIHSIIIVTCYCPRAFAATTTTVLLYHIRGRVSCAAVRRSPQAPSLLCCNLMRLPTHTRPCSARALCNTATLSSSSLHPASLLPSSFLRRKAVVGQSRVLLTAAAANPRGQQQQQSQAATPLRSPLQWSGIAHRARNPNYSPPAANMAGVQQQVRAHSHGHGGHHHHHDTTFLTSANRNDPGVRITRVGLYVNLGMAVAKGAGGYIFNSQA